MAQFANVYRTEHNLKYLAQAIEKLEQQLNFEPLDLAVETYHALQTAKAVVKSMLVRQESRGAHYRADYPNADQNAYKLTVNLERGQIVISKHYI